MGTDTIHYHMCNGRRNRVGGCMGRVRYIEKEERNQRWNLPTLEAGLTLWGCNGIPHRSDVFLVRPSRETPIKYGKNVVSGSPQSYP